MTSLFRSLCMSLSFGVLAYAQSGESMGTAYPVPIFSNAPTIVGNLRVWEWHTYDSTRQRVNNHNLSTGADVVWKLVLPSCLDSLEVHFCPSDFGGIPPGNKLFVINASTGDTTELLQESYDSYMQTWIINKQLPNWIWPGSAYIRGRSQSLLRRSGTGGGLGSPLYDTLRLAAGDTLYFLFTHEHGGGIGVDSVYLEIKAIQRIRPTPPPLVVSAQISPPQTCMGNLVSYQISLTDTSNDGRNPIAYWVIDSSFIDGAFMGRGIGRSTLSPISGNIAPYITNFNPNRGYVEYTVRVVGGAIYASSVYPTVTACEDTSAPSSVATYSVRLTVVPDPAIRYGGNDYNRGDTIRLPEGDRTFSARDRQGLMDSLLRYEWRLNGNVVGNSSNLTRTLTPGRHTLSVKITNTPSGATACDSSISVVLDVSRATSLTASEHNTFFVSTTEAPGHLVLYIPETGTFTAELYDLTGRILRTYSIPGATLVQLPMDLSPGAYIVRVQGKHTTQAQRIVLP